ncbi:uncharacterized protein [Engystomops pustulosus]|uniref:uncharacterized protein n=1 Tax=Engystomops pustulosus TaxID=76066 RepID=UPI003AFACC50
MFGRSLIFKKWFHTKDPAEIFETEQEIEAVRILEELQIEHNADTQIPQCVRKKSKKFPNLSSCPAVDQFVKAVSQEFSKINDQAVKNKVFDTDLAECLKQTDPTIPTLYLLPKVHKHPKIPPGRPIISGTGSLTANTVRAIPTGQFLRIRRICSSDDDFEIQADDLKNRFRQRGYSNRSLKLAYWRAKRTPRQTLLSLKEKPAIPDQVRFITNYHSQWHLMRQTLERFWPILQSDPIIEKYITPHPSVTARRAKNLRDILVRSHYTSGKSNTIFDAGRPPWGWKPCGSSGLLRNLSM